jgi:hypothetical protein
MRLTSELWLDLSSRLRRNQVKMYMDGLTMTRTALILGEYLYPEPDLGIGDSGIHYFLRERLEKYITELQVFISF